METQILSCSACIMAVKGESMFKFPIELRLFGSWLKLSRVHHMNFETGKERMTLGLSLRTKRNFYSFIPTVKPHLTVARLPAKAT